MADPRNFAPAKISRYTVLSICSSSNLKHSIFHTLILHFPFPIPAHSNDNRAIPHHVAVEGDYIYWTDIYYNTLNRALKSSGNETIILAEGAEPVSTVIVVKKSQLRRRGHLFCNCLCVCVCVCVCVCMQAHVINLS